MYKQGGKRKLGRKASHRRALITNQLRSLFASGYITTTSQKAKVLKANADSLISKVASSKDPLATVRLLTELFGDASIVKKVPAYVAKKGAAVKIVKVGFRSGDNAEVSKISLVDYVEKKKVASKKNEKNSDKDDVAKKDVVKSSEGSKGLGDRIAKSIKNRIPVNRERARSRSGL